MIDPKHIVEWCSYAPEELVDHDKTRTPFRMVKDSEEMGKLMAQDFIDVINENNAAGQVTRAIVPCGPSCWYVPFTEQVNAEQVNLNNLTVFHMDECLDWEGNPIPENHPLNFRTFMDKNFYGPIEDKLNVPLAQRFYPTGKNIDEILEAMDSAPVDICIGGWGQDGHIAYNQARRNPFSELSLEQLHNSRMRVQDNNVDTIITLGHRNFGAAYHLVPPMSVTVGVKDCLSAKKVRVYSDTGSWKQTALRVALFSDETVEYPLTLLQNHPDAIITATYDTARHPIAENPDWEFF